MLYCFNCSRTNSFNNECVCLHASMVTSTRARVCLCTRKQVTSGVNLTAKSIVSQIFFSSKFNTEVLLCQFISAISEFVTQV